MVNEFAADGPSGVVSKLRVLVLGANGRLGRFLAQAWRPGEETAEGSLLRPIWQTRRPSVSNDPYDGSTPLVFDPLTEPRALAAAVAGSDAVLVLAGPTSADADHDDHAALAHAVLKARRLAGDRDVPVLLISSAAIYGRARGSLDEAAPCAPETAYGRGKLAMERVAAGAGAVHVLRLGNVAGADALLGRAGQGGPGKGNPVTLDRFEDGTTPRRAYIGPLGLACVLEELLLQATAGRGPVAGPMLPAILNVAGGQVEMAALLEAAGLDWTPRVAPAGAIREVRLDTGRLEALVSLPPPARTAAGMVAEWRRLVPLAAPEVGR